MESPATNKPIKSTSKPIAILALAVSTLALWVTLDRDRYDRYRNSVTDKVREQDLLGQAILDTVSKERELTDQADSRARAGYGEQAALTQKFFLIAEASASTNLFSAIRDAVIRNRTGMGHLYEQGLMVPVFAKFVFDIAREDPPGNSTNDWVQMYANKQDAADPNYRGWHKLMREARGS